ncbi:MAG: hypothetical protein GWN71_12505, partial [Gammaproteobacteria bacterium]|nr:hypothetical protein [Gemmatimonadota bacterium]NIU74368.1 hypothetical protein [Gammaproteobacteria bacterium]
RHVLTTRSFAVDRVISTVDATPGMVFADPLAAGTGVSRRFQPAASYSLLLSWGSRRSTLYNRLFR